jgi:hypothetical protein
VMMRISKAIWNYVSTIEQFARKVGETRKQFYFCVLTCHFLWRLWDSLTVAGCLTQWLIMLTGELIATLACAYATTQLKSMLWTNLTLMVSDWYQF